MMSFKWWETCGRRMTDSAKVSNCKLKIYGISLRTINNCYQVIWFQLKISSVKMHCTLGVWITCSVYLSYRTVTSTFAERDASVELVKSLREQLSQAEALNVYAGYDTAATTDPGNAQISCSHRKGPVSLHRYTYDLPPKYCHVKAEDLAQKHS